MQPVEGAVDFNHPALKGKTPGQVEEIVRALEAANRQAARQIDDLKKQPSAPAPSQPVEPAVPRNEEFWNDPVNTLNTMIERSVRPLRDEIKQARQQVTQPDVRSKLRGEHKHFQVLEPIIDQVLREQDVDPVSADEGRLRSTYFLALGYAQENGIVLDTPQTQPAAASPAVPQSTPAAPVQPPAPPQHRPSSAPLPPETKTQDIGEPTEEERAVMRVYGIKSYAEFKKWQSIDPTEVASADFDQPKK